MQCDQRRLADIYTVDNHKFACHKKVLIIYQSAALAASDPQKFSGSSEYKIFDRGMQISCHHVNSSGAILMFA